MSNNEFVNMTIQHHIKQEIAIKQLKIKSIHKDIIRLKQENRNIGDKIKSLYCNMSTNALKLIDCSETAGSFSTGVACVNTNRKFLGIEMDEKYFNIGVNRMQESDIKGEIK